MNPIQQCFQKIWPENRRSYKIMGHNSDNNRWMLSLIELDLYFMIIYLCIYIVKILEEGRFVTSSNSVCMTKLF